MDSERESILTMLKLIENNINKFDFTYNGYNCLIIKNFLMGDYYCAYIGITDNNKYYGLNEENMNLHVHGGITYAQFTLENDILKSHNDNGKKLYWLGMDFMHSGDISFELNQFPLKIENHIEVEYVLDCLIDLANQLNKFEKKV